MRLDLLAVNTRAGEAAGGDLEEYLEERLVRMIGRAAGSLLDQLVDRVVVRVEELEAPIGGGRTARCRLEIKLSSGIWFDFDGIGRSPHAAIDRAVASSARVLRRELRMLLAEQSPAPGGR